MEKKAIEEMTRTDTHGSFPVLIEITEPDGTVSRLCNADSDITFEDNVFSAYNFTVTPPERKSDGIGDAKITLSAIDTVWIAKIRETQDKSTIRYIKIFLYEDDENMETETLEDIDFTLTSASWNQTTIEWTMKFDDMLDIMIPFDECDEVICPAIS